MGSKIALKNAQDQEFSINHNDNAGAISINSNDISKKSEIETTIAPYNKGFKNYIINGGFDVWQRGTSFTGLTNGTYSSDRWVVYDSVGDINYNVIRNAGVFTGGYGASYTWNSGTGIRSVIQFIENVTRFKVGSKVTISFEAYTNSTPYTVAVAIQGTKGVWASATGEVASNIALTNTKTKYSVTLTIPDWTSLGINWVRLEDTKLALKFNLGTNTNGRDFILGSVQLEEGPVATPFENRPIGLELSLCQRYFSKGLVTARGSAAGPNVLISVPFYYPVSMRVVPTVTLTDGGSRYNLSLAIVGGAGDLYSSRFEIVSGGPGDFYAIHDIWTASAEL